VSTLLFEEDGAFRAGAVLTDNVSSLQVELPGGRRVKVKATHVLLRFAAPSAETLLAEAHALSESIDTAFLWEVCPDTEFGFETLAADYAGHSPTPVEATAILLRLHSAPIWFHRKGRGRFRRAPADILQAALAGQEKKRLQQQAVEHMTGQLVAGTLPGELSGMLPQLLYKPDRNRLETKAFEAACAETGLSAPHLLEKCGALPSTHDYHLGRFLFEFFPAGTDFVPLMGSPCLAQEMPSDFQHLPLADVRAFSIDDAQTTEIDDAFSVTLLPENGMRVGIHIAAPGLGFSPESAQGRIARDRLSTVYMPGRKITMLPDAVVEQFTLTEGSHPPALSLYLTVAADLRVLSQETRLERVPIVANLRHHDIEPLFNEETLVNGLAGFPFHDELKRLWELSTVLEAGRGKSASAGGRKDYNFEVDWTVTAEQSAEQGAVTITERPRGSPLDKLVAELMIVANSTWGALLRDKNIAALYRAQTSGKVRMTTVAAPHEGLGVDCYAWSSSPLRRYVDLVNQWQLIAHLCDETPPFAANSPALLSALRDFELTYAAYADFQQIMERYWCLRALLQNKDIPLTAVVLRDNLVRLDSLPLVIKIGGLPVLDRDARVRFAVDRIDLMEAEIKAHFVELVEAQDGMAAT